LPLTEKFIMDMNRNATSPTGGMAAAQSEQVYDLIGVGYGELLKVIAALRAPC
jgi:hypothetical protein